MAAGLSVDLDRWRQESDELMLRVGARFARVEPRRRMTAFVGGLLAGLPRVNCWSIAGHAGEQCPRGMQRLLSSAVWDEAGVRDDLRGYVLEHFADPGAVLVVDETGDPQRNPQALHRPGPAADCTRKTAALVPLATPPPSHRPSLPPPATRTHSHMITKCRWSISSPKRRGVVRLLGPGFA
jgi:hypothetical protein